MGLTPGKAANLRGMENTVTRDHLLGSREPQLLKHVVNNLVVGDVELIVGCQTHL